MLRDRLRHAETVAARQVSLAPKPIFHAASQTIQRHSITRLKHAILYWQRIVEDRIIGKVAHRKAINPLDRARMSFALHIDTFNKQSSRKHKGLKQTG